MFNFIQIKSYDKQNNYGTDWHTDYIFKSDIENLTIIQAIAELEKLGHKPCGEMTLTYDKYHKIYTLMTKMY